MNLVRFLVNAEAAVVVAAAEVDEEEVPTCPA